MIKQYLFILIPLFTDNTYVLRADKQLIKEFVIRTHKIIALASQISLSIIIVYKYSPTKNYLMSFSTQILNLECYSTADIVKKCKKYPQFYQELQEIEVSYSHDLNMAIYASLEEIQQLGVFQIHNDKTLFISFYAYLMPSYEEYASKFYLLFIRMLDQKLRLSVGKKYSIVYFHTLCESNYPYNFLVGIFKKLPVYYYAMLDKIYTVEATYFLRKTAGLFDFGRLYKLFQRKLQNIQKLIQFVNIPEVINNSLLEKLPERLMIHVQEKTKKKIFKEQGFMQTATKDPIPFKGNPFPVVITKKDCLTIDIGSHKLDKNGIPVPLSILVNTLKHNQDYLDLEGIFRKSGSIEEEEEIIEQLTNLNDGDELKKLADYSGFAIAGVVKKFFTKLIAPIVPYAVYNKLLSSNQTVVKSQEQVTFILDFLNQLPYLNKKITLYLLAFLKLEVISRKDKNKMNNYNMSVCFCPCLFRSQFPTLADLLNSGKFAGILNIFFNRYEEIMGMQQRSSKDKEKLESDSMKNTKNWQTYRISMA